MASPDPEVTFHDQSGRYNSAENSDAESVLSENRNVSNPSHPENTSTNPSKQNEQLIDLGCPNNTSNNTEYHHRPTTCSVPTAPQNTGYGDYPTPPVLPAFNRPTLMKPDTFDGSGNFEQYASHFEDCAELSMWDSRVKNLMLAACLRGPARNFYMSLTTVERRDYNLLSSRLIDRFGSDHKHQTLWLGKLENRRRSIGESIASLADDLRQLAQKAYSDLDHYSQERLALNQLYKLVSTEMKCRCMDNNCSTINDAVTVIDRYEAIIGSSTPVSTIRACDSESSPSLESTLVKIEDRLGKIESAQSTPRGPKACFACKSLEHLWANCPRNKNARLPWDNDRYSNDVRNQRSAPEEVHTARTGRNVNENDNAFYVTCYIEGMSVNFLIDCGATSSLISNHVINKLGSSRLQPTDIVLKTVNSDILTVSGRADIKLEIGPSKFDVPFIVSEIEADGILGQDFLKHHADSINYKRSCLVLGHYTVPLWTGGRANQVCRFQVLGTHNMTVTHRSAHDMPRTPDTHQESANNENVSGEDAVNESFPRHGSSELNISISMNECTESTRAVTMSQTSHVPLNPTIAHSPEWFPDDPASPRRIDAPQQRRDDVLNYFRDIPSAAHLGADKVLGKVRQTFYWPVMKKDVQKNSTSRDVYSFRERSKPSKTPIVEAKVYEALARCVVDIYGHLPKTTSHNRYILVIFDCLQLMMAYWSSLMLALVKAQTE